MITVKPYKDQDNTESYRLGFIIEGHAEYAEHGKDIVCAGVSAIAQTALLGLNHYTYVKHTSKDGYLKVHVEKDDHTSDAIIKTLLLGIESLQEQYPDFIKLKITGETM